MKITDKIVTSVTLPQHTNVLWHNPETGELKMFDNKGWEVVGGNPGEEGGNSGGGYPVVTVTEDFNIEAQPNTFYNIKNSADSEVIIDCVDGYSVDGKGKHILLTFDGWEYVEMNLGMYFAYFGAPYVSDTSKEGYKYKMEFDLSSMTGGEVTGVLPAYFSDEVKTGNSVTCLLDMTVLGQDAVIISMNNIQILNENVNDLVWITVEGISYPHVFTEVENDNEQYQHKYNIWGMVVLIQVDNKNIYTNKPYTTATSFYLSNGVDIASMGNKVEVKPNMSITPSDVANEFVFNINSPANIIFNQNVKWHNSTSPDLSQTGIYTLSIINGVGCYTFVNT